MRTAFLSSEYYGGSAPSQAPRSAMDLSTSPAGSRTYRRKTRDGSHVHVTPIDEGGTQLYPDGSLRIRHRPSPQTAPETAHRNRKRLLVREAGPEYRQWPLVAHDDERLSELSASHVLGSADSEPLDGQVLHVDTVARRHTPDNPFSLQDSLQSRRCLTGARLGRDSWSRQSSRRAS